MQVLQLTAMAVTEGSRFSFRLCVSLRGVKVEPNLRNVRFRLQKPPQLTEQICGHYRLVAFISRATGVSGAWPPDRPMHGPHRGRGAQGTSSHLGENCHWHRAHL